MADLFVNETTGALLDAYVKTPKHGLLLIGKTGVGLRTLAYETALKLVAHTTDLLVVEPDEKGTISIERVRTLYTATRDVHTAKQAVLIDNADSMSHDAQNALLKLLEEPGANVHFVVTSHHPEQLLATIISRLQQLDVKPISNVESQTLLRRLHVSDASTLQQMLFLAGGLPAELTRLASDREYFEKQASLVRQARDFLTASLYQRLVTVSKLTDRVNAAQFLHTLANLLEFTSQKDPNAVKEKSVVALEQAADRVEHNGHVRSQLMNLAFHV